MERYKGLLLGLTTGFATAAGAQAADLPVAKAAPVEYVRVCSTIGTGFFYIPGTETCLRVGGRVRAEYLYSSTFGRAQDATGFYTRGRIQLDARTMTAYGLLRSVVRFEITRRSGSALNGFGGNAAVSNGIPLAGTIITSPQVAEAFIQFGGLTAGRVISFFSNSDLPTEHFGTLRFDDAPDVDLLAYTFSFGNGFSATLSIEDGLERRLAGFIPGGFAANTLLYAGQRAPDLVGNIKYTGTWGTAQISGAVHQIRSLVLTNAVGGPIIYGPLVEGTIPDTEYGFAAAGYLSFNLPQLAPGDALWLAATYTNGALAYMNGGNSATAVDPNNQIGAAGAVGMVDAYINPITGDIKRGHGWSIAGGFRHYWTPQIRQSIFGSYMRVEYGAGASTIVPAGFTTGLVDFNELRLGSNVIWSPVSGLDLGLEVIYAKLDPRGRVFVPSVIPGVPGTIEGSSHSWEGRLRVQRDF
ncbi:porin [Microvirga puerhi]|uniref:Porin n=1 Tax=Microvirga puerhi TaxID=2876078 RepID=A0ABS7VNY0_9HYPH|nr:porin [Microvirga puerhi]MBZ6077225.1 porin [Microvirga puerhi]